MDPTFDLAREEVKQERAEATEAIQRIWTRAVDGDWADWPLESIGGYLLDYAEMDEVLEILDGIAIDRAHKLHCRQGPNGHQRDKLDIAWASIPASELEPEIAYFSDEPAIPLVDIGKLEAEKRAAAAGLPRMFTK